MTDFVHWFVFDPCIIQQNNQLIACFKCVVCETSITLIETTDQYLHRPTGKPKAIFESAVSKFCYNKNCQLCLHPNTKTDSVAGNRIIGEPLESLFWLKFVHRPDKPQFTGNP